MSSFIGTLTETIARGEFSLLLLVMSFFGGVVASLSPCVLALMPIIIGYVGGYSKEDSKQTFVQLFSFVVGLSLVLSFIGVICALSGRVLSAFAGHYWVLVLASLIMIFGLNILGVVELYFEPIVKEFPKSTGNNLVVYPMIVGGAFALASTPCSTPILAAIMSVASLSENVWTSMSMLFMFSMGQGLIIILAGVFISSIKTSKKFKVFSEILMKLSGLLLVCAALYIYYRVFGKFF